MKNSNFIKNSIIALLPISFALGVIFVDKTVKASPVDAFDYTSLSKMDINLNDTSSEDIRNYYSDLNNLATADKKGTKLLENLKPILAEGQKYFSYDSGKESIWRLYEISDRDWEKSPASEVKNGTYDKTTNIIKGYTFAAGKSDETKNPYVHALYMNRDIDNPVKAWGNHEQDGTGINQEHIWAKSHGFDSAGSGTSGGARGDPMHLWAGNGWANNVHSNYYFGYVDLDGDVTDANTRYPDTVGHNYKGKSLTLGSGTVFEPQDSDKGDIARAIFYMAARYNNYAGATKDIDGNDPNLILSNTIDNRTGTSGPNDPFSMGVLSDLLEWNKIDPPDEYEIHRNNLLYTNFTHNRNPFIDFPEWADIAFGDSSRSADPEHDKINGSSTEKQLLSISVTTNPDKTSYLDTETFSPNGMVVKANYDDGTSVPVTGYTWSPNGVLSTSVTKVTISYGGKTADVNITVKSSVIHPNSITISPNSFELESGSSRRLTATVLPTDTTTKGVTWTSSNTDVATVSSTGYVTAVGPGTATIKAITKDAASSVFGSATVTVPEPIVLDRIVLSGNYKTSFYQGDSYSNKGITVTAYLKQGSVDVSNEDVTEYTEFYGFDSSTVGNCTVYAYYQGKYTSYNVTIEEVPVEENTVNFSFPSYEFENGQTISSVSSGDYTITFFGPETSAAYYDTGTGIRVYHENSFTIAGSKKIVEISFTYGSGDKRGTNVYNVDKGIVDPETGHWTMADGADSVTFTLSGSTSGHRRIKEVKVVYDDSKDAAKSLLSITIDGTPKTQFYKGDAFDQTGLVVNAHYSDFTVVDVTSSVVITGFDSSTTGYKKLTVSYTEGEFTKTSGYQVKVNSISVISIDLSGEYKTEFIQGETFTYEGLVITAHNNNGTTFDASDKCTISNPDMTTVGTKTITVTYKLNVDASYTISVVKDPAQTVNVSKTIHSIASENSWISSTKYTSFDLDDVVNISVAGGSNSGKYYTSGYEWRIYQSESPVLNISVDEGYKLNEVIIGFTTANNGALLFKNSPVNSGDSITTSCGSVFFYVGNSSSGTSGQVKITSIEVTYSGGTPSSRVLEDISISGSYQTSYFVGDQLNTSGLITTAQFSNGLYAKVEPVFSGFDSSVAGNKTITVSYSENNVTKFDSYLITVSNVVPVEIVLSGNYKKTFIENEDFTYDGLVVVCNYNNGDSNQVTNYDVSGYDKTKLGSQTITVSYVEKGTTLTNTYTVTVVAATPVSLEIESKPSKTSYFVGDEFSGAGIVAKCTLDNGSVIDVSDDVTFSDYDMDEIGEQTVTVSYADGNKTVTDTYLITVNAVLLDHIVITSKPSKISYYVGEELNTVGLTIEAYYNNGSHKQAIPTSISGYNKNQTGKQTVIVHLNELGIEKTATFDVTVNAVVAESIVLSGEYKTSYIVGDTFSSEGLIVTAKYNNKTEAQVTPTSIVGYDMQKAGVQTVIVYYGDLSATYNITVEEVPVVLSSISLSGDYQEEFMLGDDFNSDGLIVTAHYDNGTSKVVEPTSISGYDMFEEGVQEVLVEYEENGKTMENTYEISVISPITLSSIKLSGTYQKEFYTGDDFSYEGLKVTAVYSDGTTKDVNSFEVSGFDSTKVGYQTIKVSYEEDGTTVSTTYTVKLIQLQVSYIELSGNYKTEYEVGEAYSMEGLVVTAYYNNSTSKVVSPSSISGYKGTKAGNEIITVSYKENGIEVSTRYVVKITDKETPVPPKEETNLPVIVGAAGGGVVGLGAIITIICVVLKKKH
ncbi:MAG: bacterial Ig-like domain-containing protein [Bacilli bacterium]|nr:bacterial Ig-like domain-containing protein [Bacilli bacterium]